MNTEEESRKGRRWFVTKFAGRTVLAGLGALTLGRLIGKDGISAQAADGNPLIIGQANSGSSTTFLSSSPPGDGAPAFAADTAATVGTAIRGIGLDSAIQGFANSPIGTGILGVATSTSPVSGPRTPIGVSGFASSPSGTGVFGHAAATSGQTTGTVGESDSSDGVGLFGFVSSTNPGTLPGKPVGVAGFTASPTGLGIAGRAAAPTGHTTGVLGGADSPDGTGVSGQASATSGQTTGVGGQAASPDGVGVFGANSSTSPGTVPGKPVGVAGFTASPTGRGVDGNAAAPSGQTIGVSGEAASPDGTGVAGFAASATGATKGVVGTSLSPDGIGVLASNPAGRALQVNGLASFSTVSAGVIPAGQASFTVSDARVTLGSHITVALTGDPGNRASVDWVERNPGVGFTINLTRGTANDTPFTYLIVEPN